MNHLAAGLRVALEEDDIRIPTLMSGVAATNIIRELVVRPAQTATIISGAQVS